MVFCLQNQTDAAITLNLTSSTWFGILDLAMAYGWNPLGTVRPGIYDELDIALAGYSLDLTQEWFYSEETRGRLVLLEDALNLADALDQALTDYEPLRVPTSFYLFEPESLLLRIRPSIGAIAEVINLCRSGPFWIVQYRTPNGETF